MSRFSTAPKPFFLRWSVWRYSTAARDLYAQRNGYQVYSGFSGGLETGYWKLPFPLRAVEWSLTATGFAHTQPVVFRLYRASNTVLVDTLTHTVGTSLIVRPISELLAADENICVRVIDPGQGADYQTSIELMLRGWM
ncbi:MAG: hypothetical protein HYZ29_23370 [Myxococcales bacterium]|nr:hypothetical protein [Myxococcales bacterium]